MRQQRNAFFYRPADVLAAFSRASADGEDIDGVPRERSTPVLPALSMRARAWIRQVRGEIERGRQSIKKSLTAHPSLVIEGSNGLLPFAKGAAPSLSGLPTGTPSSQRTAKLISHFAIPEGEDGSGTA